MPGNIPKHKLLIISDTAICRTQKGYLAFEPVLREVEVLSTLFEQVIWLGCKVKEGSTVLGEVKNNKIKVVAMPSVRNTYLNAIMVLLAYPLYLFYILRYLPTIKFVHTRAPSHPAWLAMFLSKFDRYRYYWHKYAGNWIAETLPYTYDKQRSLLKSLPYKNIKVTVNGNKDMQDGQVISFENPCLYEAEIKEAKRYVDKKDFSGELKLLYVGALVEGKGILQLIEAIESKQLPAAIKEVFIIGNGPLRDVVKKRSRAIEHLTVNILGVLSREQLNEYYAAAHMLLSPSRSEGFPKVISEAAAYGCIPLITDISTIGQYIINGKTGFLMQGNSADVITQTLCDISKRDDLKKISTQAAIMSTGFTYEYFLNRIKGEVFPELK